VLVPRLRKDDVVVLDNLNVHKASQVEQLARWRGARVFWSKIKTFLRAAKARTREELEAALRLQGRIRMNTAVVSSSLMTEVTRFPAASL
jgi:hypothetical protein